jgi:hypothetical protein
MGVRWKDGYSSRVEIFLLIGEEKFRVAQVGPDSFILREGRRFPPGTEGELAIVIDDREQRHHVFLMNGIACISEPVMYL